MTPPNRLPDEALDSLLDGSPSADAVGTPLAAYLDAVRHHAATIDPQPSEELAVVLAEGRDASEDDGIVTAGAGGATASWRRRSRLAVRALATKFAALGLLTKAAAAGAAVTVAASGAGVAGVLPPPAQNAFDDALGRQAPAAADIDDDGDDAPGEQGVETGGAAPDTPADTSSTAPLDSDLSDDATGSSDEEPGVDGREVASDASDGRSDVSEAPARSQQDGAPEEPPADDAPAGTPAEDVVEDRPGEDGPPASDEDEAGQGAAGQDAADGDAGTDGSDQPGTGTERPPRARNAVR